VDTLHVVVPGQGGRIVSPLTMQWASADPNVARVSLTGVVTAVAPGKTALSVSGLLQTKSVDIVVHRSVQGLQVRPKVQGEIPVPMQGTARFEAHALGADDQPVPEAPLRWSVGDTTLASFDPATGVLTGRKASTPPSMSSCRVRSWSRARGPGACSCTPPSARTWRSCAKCWMTAPRPPSPPTHRTARAWRSYRLATASPRST